MGLEVEIKKKLKEFTLESKLKVEDGCTGLMGPSGSGKSITLKSIAVNSIDCSSLTHLSHPLYER